MKMFLLGVLMVAGLVLPAWGATTPGGVPIGPNGLPRVSIGGGGGNPNTASQMDCVNHPQGGGTDPNGNPYLACVDDNLDPATMGQTGVTLSQQFYCQSKYVLSGNFGLLIGLAVALLGLYQMVNGAVAGGLILLLCGALITALPSLVESTMKGTYSFVSSTLGSGSSGGEMCLPICNGMQATGTTGNCKK